MLKVVLKFSNYNNLIVQLPESYEEMIAILVANCPLITSQTRTDQHVHIVNCGGVYLSSKYLQLYCDIHNYVMLQTNDTSQTILHDGGVYVA